MSGTFRLSALDGRRVAVEPVVPSDTHIFLWGHAVTSTTCARITAEQARALGHHLLNCADRIDPRPRYDDPNGA